MFTILHVMNNTSDPVNLYTPVTELNMYPHMGEDHAISKFSNDLSFLAHCVLFNISHPYYLLLFSRTSTEKKIKNVIKRRDSMSRRNLTLTSLCLILITTIIILSYQQFLLRQDPKIYSFTIETTDFRIKDIEFVVYPASNSVYVSDHYLEIIGENKQFQVLPMVYLLIKK